MTTHYANPLTHEPVGMLQLRGEFTRHIEDLWGSEEYLAWESYSGNVALMVQAEFPAYLASRLADGTLVTL